MQRHLSLPRSDRRLCTVEWVRDLLEILVLSLCNKDRMFGCMFELEMYLQDLKGTSGVLHSWLGKALNRRHLAC